MRTAVQLLLLLIFPPLISSKFVIEPCNSSDSCNALLSYRLPHDSKLSEIASRFQKNVTDILASNSLDPTTPLAENQIIPTNSLVKIPISCPCVDGIRRSVSTLYTVRPIDTIDTISTGFGGLVSPEQIAAVNGISGSKRVESEQSLVIPLPCSCFNNSNNGVTTVYLSYVVEGEESLSSIAEEYGTTETDLVAVNGLGNPSVYPGDLLAVPLPACSSANLKLYDESLLVPNATYALTAFNCVQCTCGPNDLTLRCFPSPTATFCSHFQCKGTNLFIGDVREERTAIGCNLTTCLYRGHNGHKIRSSLSSASQLPCSGNHSHSAMAPSPYLLSNPIVTPSVAPIPASCPAIATVGSLPTSKQNANVSVAKRVSCLGVLLLELIILTSSLPLI